MGARVRDLLRRGLQTFMRSSLTVPWARIALVAVLFAHRASAQDPAGRTPPAEPTALGGVTPPNLRAHPDPIYPPAALSDRLSGTVELEVSVDATGHVVDAKVTRPAGHNFDEAALAAVRQWVFEPAKQG